MTAATACRTCRTEAREGARFCDGCGAPIIERDAHAEYKQVTVLFADVVHSMDIAAAVGAERLREIMADLTDRCATVVQRYGSRSALDASVLPPSLGSGRSGIGVILDNRVLHRRHPRLVHRQQRHPGPQYPHIRPGPSTSPANPATTGTMPKHRNVGR
jgi:class 3 adenylate cyclase